uniref:BHLH domain-containing protein n=1 Tax=Glossina brevipalpis TaxID=37001 RepID=A0A1A9WNY9_9MUSC
MYSREKLENEPNSKRMLMEIDEYYDATLEEMKRKESLRKLLMAAILQQTSTYICELENQKTQLLAQNSQLKRQLGQHEAGGGGGGGPGNGGGGGDGTTSADAINGVAIKKRKLTDNVVNVQAISDSSDEGLGSMSPEPMTLLSASGATSTSACGVVNTKAQMLLAQNAAKEILDLKEQLFKERRLRTALEEELQAIKRQLITVATAPQPTAGDDCTDGGSSTYIPREVIEHTGNLVRDDCEEFSYVEIDELTGQQQVVVCSSIEELENETAAAAAEIITEDNVHEEVILSSTSSTESEQEVAVNAIAKAYAEGNSPSPDILQPILQAAIKATPKVEVERITDATLKKVKTEKIEQTSGLTRSRQNLETIVEAIRHLEGDHLFTDGTEQHKVLVAQAQQHVSTVRGQEVPLALTTKQHIAQRKTLSELRPFLQLKGGTKHVTIVGNALTLSKNGTAVIQTQKDKSTNSTGITPVSLSTAVTPTAIYKVPTTNNNAAGGNSCTGRITSTGGNLTITGTALKQCRPGAELTRNCLTKINNENNNNDDDDDSDENADAEDNIEMENEEEEEEDDIEYETNTEELCDDLMETTLNSNKLLNIKTMPLPNVINKIHTLEQKSINNNKETIFNQEEEEEDEDDEEEDELHDTEEEEEEDTSEINVETDGTVNLIEFVVPTAATRIRNVEETDDMNETFLGSSSRNNKHTKLIRFNNRIKNNLQQKLFKYKPNNNIINNYYNDNNKLFIKRNNNNNNSNNNDNNNSNNNNKSSSSIINKKNVHFVNITATNISNRIHHNNKTFHYNSRTNNTSNNNYNNNNNNNYNERTNCF